MVNVWCIFIYIRSNLLPVYHDTLWCVICSVLVTEIYYLLADYYFKNKEMTCVSTVCEFHDFLSLREA